MGEITYPHCWAQSGLTAHILVDRTQKVDPANELTDSLLRSAIHECFDGMTIDFYVNTSHSDNRVYGNATIKSPTTA